MFDLGFELEQIESGWKLGDKEWRIHVSDASTFGAIVPDEVLKAKIDLLF